MRLIFSIYIEFEDKDFDNNKDLSKNLHNKKQFKDNYNFLISKQQQYAKEINVDYKLFTNDKNWKEYRSKFEKEYPYISKYNIVNFYKIHLLYEMSEIYDEIAYLDFDVVPITKENIFNFYNLKNGIVCKVNHEQEPKTYLNLLSIEEIKNREKWYKQTNSTFSERSPTAKYWNCKAMLLDEGHDGENDVYNTGIILSNSKNIKKLNYFNDFRNVILQMHKLKTENGLWPLFIRDCFGYDNETVFSFKMKHNNVRLVKMDDDWHHTMHKWSYIPSGTKMVHVINKDFEHVKEYVKKNNI